MNIKCSECRRVYKKDSKQGKDLEKYGICSKCITVILKYDMPNFINSRQRKRYDYKTFIIEDRQSQYKV